jgi:hypothetical protein
VLAELRAHNFAVLSTVDGLGQPDSAGVSYGVSPPGSPLALYVMTRRHLKKARNIARNPRVSLVVPLPRRVFGFVPPATIQLKGRAEILDWTDPAGTDVFRRFWVGRRILGAYEQSRRRGETRVCFLKITLDPVVRTYAVGYAVWDLRRRMESAAATVRIPPEHQASDGARTRLAQGRAAPSPFGRSRKAEASLSDASASRAMPVAGDPSDGSRTNEEEARICARD